MKKLLYILLISLVAAFWLSMPAGKAYAAGGTCTVNSTNGQVLPPDTCDSGYHCVGNIVDPGGPVYNGECVLNSGGTCNTNNDCGVDLCCNSGQCGRCGSVNTTTTTTPAKCANGQTGIDTELGCIPTDPAGLANAIFTIFLGVAGGVAILLIILGGFKVAGSQGNVEALEDGRDMITKAITGLVFILLASVILSIIGLDILGLKAAFGPTGVFPIGK